MSKVALGFIETGGNTGSVQAIDAMVKAANVDLVGKVEVGSSLVTAIVRGEVGAVRASVEAGAEAAARVGELICTNVIPSAHADVFGLLGLKR